MRTDLHWNGSLRMREPLCQLEFLAHWEGVGRRRPELLSADRYSVVLAAPASSSAAHCPNAVVAFVTLNNEVSGNEEKVLLAARCCADNHPLDQSVNFGELAMGNLNECGGSEPRPPCAGRLNCSSSARRTESLSFTPARSWCWHCSCEARSLGLSSEMLSTCMRRAPC